MQKNRKATQNAAPRRRTSMQGPQITNIDVLAAMPDEELIGHLRSLEDGRDKAYEARADTRPWEEEIAYVRREQQIRRTRRERHDRYIRDWEREFAESEANLPVADLDNSAFTELH